MKRHNQEIPLKVGLKKGGTKVVHARKDHYQGEDGARIEYEEVAWVSTDTEEMGVWG